MLARRAHGHAWTIGPRLGSLLSGGKLAPYARPFRVDVHGAQGRISVTGKLSEAHGSDTLLIALHGCGGTPDSDYCTRAARYFHTHGVSVLRLAWRGADMRGEDFYHAGQTEDLHAAVRQAKTLGYRRIWVLGFSLGGHACLRFAHESNDATVTAVACVCPVLDLPQPCRAIDAPERVLYRRYTLRGLIDVYSRVAARGRAPTPIVPVSRARTFRVYDSLTIVPRYGFRDADDYYQTQNARRVLPEIRRPTFVVSARHDPMLPASIAQDALPSLSSSTTFRWAKRGGHCFFPSDLDLGESASRGLEAQLHAWLSRHG